MVAKTSAGQELFAQACALPEEERLLLQLAALTYEPVSTSFLCRAFLALNQFFLGEQRLRYDEITAMVVRLRENGFLSGQNQCDPALAEYLVRQSIRERRFGRLASLVEQSSTMEYQHGRLQARYWRALRQFRIGLYSQNSQLIEDSLAFLERSECRALVPEVPTVAQILTCAFDPAWFAAMPVFLQFLLLNHLLQEGIANLHSSPAIEQYLQEEVPRRLAETEQIPFLRLLTTLYIMQGKIHELEQLVQDKGQIFSGTGLAGTVAFLHGQISEAQRLFQQDLEVLARLLKTDRPGFLGLPGFFCVVCLLRAGDRSSLEAARNMLETMQARVGEEGPDSLPLRCLAVFAAHLLGEEADMLALSSTLTAEERQTSLALALIVFYWLGVELAPEFLGRLQEIAGQAEASGFCWLAREVQALLAALEPAAGAAEDSLSGQVLCRLFKPDAGWRHSLSELIAAVHAVRQSDATQRLCWFLNYEDGVFSLVPKEQRRNNQGNWSAGRTLSLTRLATLNQPWITGQDQALCAALLPAAGEKEAEGSPDQQRLLPALVGHPLLFLQESPKVPVEVVAAEPELMVECHDEALFLHFSPPVGEQEYSVWQETATRFKVVRIQEEHRRVAAITGPDGLLVPQSASADLLATIGRLTGFMTVHSAIDMPGTDTEVSEVQGDSTPHVQIVPLGAGFRVDIFVRPFGRKGPYLKPGAGTANLIADIEGKRLKARRDLKQELLRAREVEESCPMLDLATDMETGARREWHLSAPDECLQVLVELNAIRDRVILEWPEGEKLSIRSRLNTGQLNLNIRTLRQDWFALSGTMQVDDGEVIELRFLLEQARLSKSRFIPLGDGQFLALTQEFRNRLDELLHYGNMDGCREGIRVHSLAALALDRLCDTTASTTTDEEWRRRKQAMQDLEHFQPEVPSTLKAELRDYQKDGFVWMSRMAALGFGACLADDMGLGKTLQSLALILSRAQDGPTLVVAPTSVCMNWQVETRRFAPTLNIRLLADLPRDATEFHFAPFDLVIASYTLLQQEQDLLAPVRWQTIVLDEAQAIKNSATKRSQAAMQLNGAFRLITTGTPIENHLGELWNLFTFINPGLLGSFKQFNRRFGVPIEKRCDREARKLLKKLIRPFMLRRIKADVLDELPPRTEVTLRVELSQEERNLYEALRQQALEHIESDPDHSVRQIRILAEIMRLRRACCHPRLVDESSAISSSKEQLFAELVDDLRGSGHKALVFSQFTGHLTLLRKHLDARKIPYCYLDGSTAAAQRRNQVDLFQSGAAELFLISLKAGGLGLNLTAADYVIHMDPWWNPAVEDQAADRAHRIGQTRPVTVYRLMTVGTIEEKIVQLHHKKRDLANSLLEGTDVSARIGVEELLELIRGE